MRFFEFKIQFLLNLAGILLNVHLILAQSCRKSLNSGKMLKNAENCALIAKIGIDAIDILILLRYFDTSALRKIKIEA